MNYITRSCHKALNQRELTFIIIGTAYDTFRLLELNIVLEDYSKSDKPKVS